MKTNSRLVLASLVFLLGLSFVFGVKSVVHAQAGTVIGHSFFRGSILAPIYLNYGTEQDIAAGSFPNYITIDGPYTLEISCYSYGYYDPTTNTYDSYTYQITGPGTFGSSNLPSACMMTGTATTNGQYLYSMGIKVVGSAIATAPTNLVATADKHAEVELSWQDSSPLVTGYSIEVTGDIYSVGSFGPFQQLKTVNSGVTSYIISDLPPEYTQKYRVRAILQDGTYSDYSNVATITTLPPLPTPSLTVTKISNSNIALKWSITSSDYWTIDSSAEIKGYKILRRLGANNRAWSTIATVSGTQAMSASGPVYNDTSPVVGNLNFYGVEAYDDTSTSHVSSDWLGSYVDITPPSVPVLSLSSFFIKSTVNGVVYFIPIVVVGGQQSTDDNDNYGDHTFKAFGYNLYRYNPDGSKVTIGTQMKRPDIGDGDLGLAYHNGFEDENKDTSATADLKVGSNYCYTASAYDISILNALNNDYTPQNTSAESQKNCITIPNPPSTPAPTVSGVSPVSGGANNTYNASGSNLSPTGNSVILKPSTTSALVPSTVLQANSASFFDVIWNFFRNLIPRAHGQVSVVGGYGSYTINNLTSSDGTNLTFSVPSNVPNGIYKVSIVNANNIQIDTTYTVTVTGNVLTVIPPSLGTSSTTPATTIQLIATTTPAVASYSCASGYSLTTNNSCYKAAVQTTIPASTVSPIPVYGCGASGATLSGTWCSAPGGRGFAAVVMSYTCPAGSTLNLTTATCVIPASTVTTPASTISSIATYSCAGGYTLSGSICNLNMIPVSFTTSASTQGQVNLSWNNNAINLSAISIERATSQTSGFIQIGTASSSATSYTDTGLLPLTPYYYRARMIFLGGTFGPYTSTSTITTLKPTVPSAVVATTLSSSSVKLSWADNDAGVISYTITQMYPASSTFTTANKLFTVNGLQPITKYCYVISSNINIQNNSSLSTQTCATTSSATSTATTTTPVIPINPATTTTFTTSIPATPVYRCPVGVYHYISAANMCNPVTNLGVLDTTRPSVSGTAFGYSCPDTYTVSGSVCMLNAASSSTVKPATTIYTCPSKLLPIESDVCIPLSTSQFTMATVLGYACPDNNYVPSGKSCVLVNGGVTTLTSIPAQLNYTCPYVSSSGTPYVCRNGISNDVLPTISFICPSGYVLSGQACNLNILTATSLVSSATVQGQVSLKWNTSGIADMIGASVERATVKNGPYTQVTIASSTSVTTTYVGATPSTTYGYLYTDTGLQPSTTYYYNVRLVYAGNFYGPYTATSTATTLRSTTTTPVTPPTSTTTPVTPTNPATTTIPTVITVPATVTYTCSTGTLSGTSCVSSSTLVGRGVTPIISNVCPAGYRQTSPTQCSLSSGPGGSGRTYNASSTIKLPIYSCQTGLTLNTADNLCYAPARTTTMPATQTYTCATGYILNLSTHTCSMTVSVNNTTSSTANVWDAVFGWFTGLFR